MHAEDHEKDNADTNDTSVLKRSLILWQRKIYLFSKNLIKIIIIKHSTHPNCDSLAFFSLLHPSEMLFIFSLLLVIRYFKIISLHLLERHHWDTEVPSNPIQPSIYTTLISLVSQYPTELHYH